MPFSRIVAYTFGLQRSFRPFKPEHMKKLLSPKKMTYSTEEHNYYRDIKYNAN